MRGVIVARRLRRPSSSPYSLTVAVRRERKDNEERRFDIVVPRLVATSPTDVAPGSREGGGLTVRTLFSIDANNERRLMSSFTVSCHLAVTNAKRRPRSFTC
jgi:hypothetical protein